MMDRCLSVNTLPAFPSTLFIPTAILMIQFRGEKIDPTAREADIYLKIDPADLVSVFSPQYKKSILKKK